MKTFPKPAIVLAFLLLFFLGFVESSTKHLPERVATHFDGNGRPNGWMSRSSHRIFITALGLALPLGITGICYLLRFVPNNAINVPKREYWLAPERRQETVNFLFQSSMWFASALVVFVMAIHALLIRANRQVPVRLETPLLLAVMAFLLAAAAVWIIKIFRRFRSPPISQGRTVGAGWKAKA